MKRAFVRQGFDCGFIPSEAAERRGPRRDGGSAAYVGIRLWLVYGFIKGEAAIIATNAVTLVLGAAIVWMKLKYK
jgi:hypothetical protein